MHRNSSVQLPSVPSVWSPLSIPSPEDVPFNLLTRSERKFLSFIRVPRLFTQKEFLFLLRDCFGSLLENIGDDSLRAQLLSGECYADRNYYDSRGDYVGCIRVFRLGLVCVSPMARKGVRLVHYYCYPFTRPAYHLVASNFVRPFPVHTPFAQFCFSALSEGLSEELWTPTDPSRRKIPLWHGTGNHVADNCYRLTLSGRQELVWFEVHTGAEGYDEEYFIPRLLSAERFCKGKGRYVVIVPFKRNLSTARFAIEKYNRVAVEDDEKPILELKISEVISYTGIDGFREKLGLYQHRTSV